jgi:putative CocE/NonD family hydrolase
MRVFCFVLLLALGVPGDARSSLQDPAPATAPAQEVVREHDVAVPMRDGVVLRAEVWRPRGTGPFPVLVYRTPYGKDDAVASYTIFGRAVGRGYAIVAQDVRGRYASGGEFSPYRNEGRDGFDTIEWAAAQPWSNGAVGTFGLSYPGAVQWLAAVENPPHLKAMVPAMTYSSPRRFFYFGGVFDSSWPPWIWLNIAPDVRVKKNLPGPKTYKEAVATWKTIRSRVLGTLPLSAVNDLRDVAPWYFEWLEHPAADPWWDWAELQGKYGRTQAAVLNLSGWNDDAYGPDGATTNFAGLVAARQGRGEPARTRLLIGPWQHGSEETGMSRVGDRDFGSAAPIDYDEVVLGWMDHYVRGIENGVDRDAPVRVFVMGDNRWRDAAAWPLPEARTTAFYFAGGERAGGAGALTPLAPTRDNASSAFASNPARPVTDPHNAAAGAHDYRALTGRTDLLTFETPPLADDLEVVGPITAEVYVSSDAPDLDLWVRVYDVAPDGTAWNLMSPGTDVVRASYRSGTTRRELLRRGRVYQLRLPGLVTANTFRKGHRIRAQISGAFFPHLSRNLQTGKLEAVSADTRAATITVHHDRRYASRLLLPVVPRPPAPE